MDASGRVESGTETESANSRPHEGTHGAVADRYRDVTY